MRLIFATGNANKMREIREIMDPDLYEILSMKGAGIDLDIDENGTTFEENALIKARAVHEKCPDAVVLADDSGLEVDAMHKEPGIYSARFMGHDTSYDLKNTEILKRLAEVPEEKRTARFVCAIAAAFPDGEEKVIRRTMEGKIAHAPAGENGFGYDPIFIPDGYDITSAEMDPEEKNAISHRGKALGAMKEELVAYARSHTK